MLIIFNYASVVTAHMLCYAVFWIVLHMLSLFTVGSNSTVTWSHCCFLHGGGGRAIFHDIFLSDWWTGLNVRTRCLLFPPYIRLTWTEVDISVLGYNAVTEVGQVIVHGVLLAVPFHNRTPEELWRICFYLKMLFPESTLIQLTHVVFFFL